MAWRSPIPTRYPRSSKPLCTVPSCTYTNQEIYTDKKKKKHRGVAVWNRHFFFPLSIHQCIFSHSEFSTTLPCSGMPSVCPHIHFSNVLLKRWEKNTFTFFPLEIHYQPVTSCRHPTKTPIWRRFVQVDALYSIYRHKKSTLFSFTCRLFLFFSPRIMTRLLVV